MMTRSKNSTPNKVPSKVLSENQNVLNIKQTSSSSKKLLGKRSSKQRSSEQPKKRETKSGKKDTSTERPTATRSARSSKQEI